MGHTIVPEIVGLHGGKVIAVDVDHYENRKNGKSRALLIKNNRFYVVTDNGKTLDLPVLNGFACLNMDGN